MDNKSPEAFRTISEVAEWLGVPTHVLRFWESRFAQVKPVKRAGGRRYYRPTDMELLGGIRKLLHDDGMTIRGVQKLLREEGVKYVSAMSPPLDLGAEIDEPPSNVVPLARKGDASGAEAASESSGDLTQEDAEQSTPGLEDLEMPGAQAAQPEEEEEPANPDIEPESPVEAPLDELEAIEFLSHDADIAPPDEAGKTAGPADPAEDAAVAPDLEEEPAEAPHDAGPDTAQAFTLPDLPDDPADTSHPMPGPGPAADLRRLKAEGLNLDREALSPIAARLEALAQRMQANRGPRAPH